MEDLNKRLVEVEYILKKLDDKYLNKIPQEIWDYIEENKDLIASFGRIQYYEKAEKDEDGAKKAKSLYKELSQIKRTFTLSGVQGDVRVRGGSPYYVDFFNQDRAEYIRGWYRVNSVTHHFKDSTYTMDMDVTLIGDMDERGWKAGEKWIKEGA